MLSTRAARCGMTLLGALALVLVLSSHAAAQDAPVAVSGGVDVTNQYNFRGIRQNGSEASIWPWVDVAFAGYKGDGGLKSASVNGGIWTAFNTELTDKWYEADYYATLGLGFGGGVSLGTTYTSYTSPNDYFTHVKEVSFKLAVDDSESAGAAALKPYALMAFELNTGEHTGQADGGLKAGKYLELGVGPGFGGDAVSVAVPIKVGLSVGDYYEHPVTGEDSKFGFFSIAGIVTVPMGEHWNVHGGAEYQKLGKTTKFFFDDKSNRGIASIGVGFSY